MTLNVFADGETMVTVDSDEAVRLVRLVMEQMEQDKLLALRPNSVGGRTLALVKQLKELDWGIVILKEEAVDVVEFVLRCLSKASGTHFSSAGKQAMFLSFIQGRVDVNFVDRWINAVNSVCPQHDLRCVKNVLQHFVERLLPILSQQKRMENPVGHADAQLSKMSNEEKQVLYYAVGYIPRKIARRLTRSKTTAASVLAHVVRSWIRSSKSQPEGDIAESCEWTLMQDRGGLVQVSQEFFRFMISVEEATAPILNHTTIDSFRDENIIPVVASQLKAMPNVQVAWQGVVADRLQSEELCEALLEEVLKSWVSTKANQAVKLYIFNAKQKKSGSAARMGTPALRKTIDKH